MRYHALRFDIWLCLALGFLLSLGTVKIANSLLPQKYEQYVEDHTVADGDVGGIADTTVFRAQSIDDLLSHDIFTVVSHGIKYRNEGAGYFGSYYMYSLQLPSGERVAAIYNHDSVQQSGSSLTSGDNILPVGRVVFEDLTTSETFLNQIEYGDRPLSRYDFYVDMCGNGGKVSEDTYSENATLFVQMLTVIIAFPLLHMLGSKLGIFPSFFNFKKKEKSEWE